MLDPEEGTALQLATGGDSLPVRIRETEDKFWIDWTHDYRIDGNTFGAIERTTGQERMITGYPTRELLSC